MCGIAGEIRFDGRPGDREAVSRMMDQMRPRGPDASGLLAEGAAVLGHRRLKIIDLSEAANQPLEDPELGLAVVFNGCIYNFRELREGLEERGYRFRTHSDTEVILKGYHAWGSACVERFNGMFAFAVLERDTGRLFAARDRLGIKPFYYQASGGRLRFASALPALLAAEPGASHALDPVALHQYMSFHSVVPAPRTLIRDIRKLPPATRMTVHPDGRREEETWWVPEFTREPGEPRGFDEWKSAVRDCLDAAVTRRMVADVGVGVLLSGGVDSSLVVGLLAEHGAYDLNTFTIGFESVGDAEGNEFPYSDIIAERFGTRHHKIEIDSSGLVEHLPACFRAMSEPMVSHDNIGFYLLSREVAKHVKVVQSGQGADEVFAGYHWYPPMLESAAPVDDYARVFFDRDQDEMRRVLSDRWLDGDHSRAFVEDYFATARAETPVDKALHLDTNVMLVDDPVKRVDNMTMAWGLEARVPFLDHELVELAGRIPPEMKVAEGGKHVLKEMAREVIPGEVIDRPKGYFPVPELKYLRGPSLEFVKDALNAPAAHERQLFRREYLDELLDDPQAHITPLNGSKLWQVACLEIWLQTHGI